MELFEIFTFGYIDDANKENNDDIYNKIKIKVSDGFTVNNVSKDNKFCDSINGNNTLTTIQVQSVFKSNAKPLILLSLHCNQTLSSRMVFRKGKFELFCIYIIIIYVLIKKR